MKRSIVVLVIVLALLFVASACAPVAQPVQESTEKEEAKEEVAEEVANGAPKEEEAAEDGTFKTVVEITDALGREITFEGVPQTIVSLAPSATEIVYALGAGHKVIGVDAYSNFPEEAAANEIVGDFNGPDIEKIVSLEPDVVLAHNTIQADAITDLENLGIVVVAASSTTLEGIPEVIEMLGELLGEQDNAAALVKKIKDVEAAVMAKGEQLAEKPTVYVVLSYGDMGNWTSGPGSFINDMIETAGGIAATADGGAAWMEYVMEDLLALDPDILIVTNDGYTTAQGVMEAQGYKELTAVKEGRVYDINADIASRSGPRISLALQWISDIITNYSSHN